MNTAADQQETAIRNPQPLAEYCKRLGVSPDTVQKWADAGQVKIWQPGGKGGKRFVVDA